MTASNTIDGEELAWLHALARALVSGGESPEDLAQETALRALELERPDGAPIRAWLASVMRGLRANRRRADRRRSWREQRGSDPSGDSDDQPSTSDLLTRAETAARLAAAARDLSEPQRRTVLLHFLEGLSIKEIARHEGRPEDTVRWRLRRGLEQLRERLVERSGHDWEWWTAALAPLARPSFPAAPAVAGTFLLVTAMKWSAIAAAAILALTFAWPPWGSSRPAGSEDLVRISDEGRVADATDEETDEDVLMVEPRVTAGDSDRSSAGSVEVSATPAGPGFLNGHVVNEAGLPIGGATISLTRDDVQYSPSRRGRVTRTISRADGTFSFDEEAVPRPLLTTDSRVTLNAIANGYQREVVADALRERPEEGWRVVLGRGNRLQGRVLDPEGQPVPGLDLVAFRTGMRVDHMSSTRRRQRVDFARLVSGNEDHLCTATTSRDGSVTFEGLGDGPQRVVSLDTAWDIDGPETATPGAEGLTWTARACIGVVVEVHDPDGVVELVDATFNVEGTDDAGEPYTYGQWVGRGDGEVSMTLTSADLPITPATARFFGTVSVGNRTADWSADVLEELPAVARVRVEMDELETVDDEPEDLPMRDIVLDVRREDGTFVELSSIYVTWTTTDGARSDGARARAGEGPGRFVATVPVKGAVLEVTEANAQGSIAPWRATMKSTADGPVRVTLAVGATVTFLRPPGLEGDWKLRAQRGDDPEGPWRGGWTYGTDEASIEFSAVDAGFWWFRISQTDDFDDPVAEYVFEVSPGDDLLFGN